MPGATRHLQREFSLGPIVWRINSFFQQVVVSKHFGLLRVPFCGGSCFHTSELMYLTNGYSVFKEHQGACGPLNSLLQLSTPQTDIIFLVGIPDTDVESLHECVHSDFDLERLVLDIVLMGELKQALKAWKPWAEELLELYLSGAKRSCTNALCGKYKVSDRTVQRWKDAFEKFIWDFLKK